MDKQNPVLMSDSKPDIFQEDPFSQLKQLLLNEDQTRIGELEAEIRRLQAQLNEKDHLIKTLEPVIAELLERKIIDSKDEMARSLAPVMSSAIKHQIRDAKEDMVDAMYPIVGRMVTKAVAEAVKKLAVSINENLNKSFSFDLWKKRIKALFSKSSIGEMLIAETLSFQIHRIFLISKNSGLLIAYINENETLATTDDAHIIGGMLTAIKSFVETSFSNDNEEGELKEIKHSDLTIRIDSGPYSYLAAVYSGVPNNDFNSQIRALHQRIHGKFYRGLREYNGDNAALQKIEDPLKAFMKRIRNM